MKKKQPKASTSYSVYFAGELFDIKHLAGNAILAESIYSQSKGKYLCHLPQDFEMRGLNPHIIRDQDIIALFESDLAVFNFDGTELDSGTVVEFMLAKFADIPSVLLRSDLRAAGDQGSAKKDPWNLMASFYPRTEVVRALSLVDYRVLQQKTLRKKPSVTTRLSSQHASKTAQAVGQDLAKRVIGALDNVRQVPPALKPELRADVYAWLAQMPGLKGRSKALHEQLATVLESKIQRDLL
ncbi:MAG: nucleoside 2-deoxyribosyltransferase [Opitutaceae bacterium]|nr:nucleoside 2-deoxyribosyltransferase [Opitutaceae bacterium]